MESLFSVIRQGNLSNNGKTTDTENKKTLEMDKEFFDSDVLFPPSQTKRSVHRFCAFFMLELIFHISGARSVYDYLFFCCHLALFQAFHSSRSIRFVKYFRSTLKDLFLLTTSYLTHFQTLFGLIFSIHLM
jgi:hypothetical protein